MNFEYSHFIFTIFRCIFIFIDARFLSKNNATNTMLLFMSFYSWFFIFLLQSILSLYVNTELKSGTFQAVKQGKCKKIAICWQSKKKNYTQVHAELNNKTIRLAKSKDFRQKKVKKLILLSKFYSRFVWKFVFEIEIILKEIYIYQKCKLNVLLCITNVQMKLSLMYLLFTFENTDCFKSVPNGINNFCVNSEFSTQMNRFDQ